MSGENTSDAGQASTGKAVDFAQKVRLGQHLESVELLRVAIGVARTRLVEVLGDIDQLERAAAAIAEGLAKERG